MTTQVPSHPHAAVPPPSAYPPAPTYSTAPPWATPAPVAADRPDAVAPPTGVPYNAAPLHGQLLVPYPEEMAAAGRMKPPAWWPVVLFTLLIGIGGLISASRRAAQAKRGRNSQAPYWLAFGITLSLSFAMVVLIIPIAVPVYLNFREQAQVTQLQDNLVTDGQLNTIAHVTATSAQCEPVGAPNDAGLRRYTCLLQLNDGGTGTIDVTASDDGTWTVVTPKR